MFGSDLLSVVFDSDLLSVVFDSDLLFVVFDYDRDTLSAKNHKSDSKHDSRSYYLKKIRNCIFLL